MKCPCCQNEMASGVVQSARQIFFTTKAHKNWFIPDVEGNNEILLSSHNWYQYEANSDQGLCRIYHGSCGFSC